LMAEILWDTALVSWRCMVIALKPGHCGCWSAAAVLV
jgi:hypothetical protein